MKMLMAVILCLCFFATSNVEANHKVCCQPVRKVVTCCKPVKRVVVRCCQPAKKVVVRCCKPVKRVVVRCCERRPVRNFFTGVGRVVTFPFRSNCCQVNCYETRQTTVLKPVPMRQAPSPAH